MLSFQMSVSFHVLKSHYSVNILFEVTVKQLSFRFKIYRTCSFL